MTNTAVTILDEQKKQPSINDSCIKFLDSEMRNGSMRNLTNSLRTPLRKQP